MPDLFAIECTTCKTRLRVRDVAVIGQILACPKCSSMVLVQAPPGFAPPANGNGAASDSHGNGATSGSGSAVVPKTPTKLAKPLPTAKPITPPAATPPAATPAAAPKPNSADPGLKETLSDSQFDEVESLFGGNGGPAKAAPAAVEAKPTAKFQGEAPKGEKRRNTPAPPPPAEHGTAPKEAAPAKPVEATPPRTRRVRMLALLTIGGLMGISLAVSAAYFVATWLSELRNKQVAELPVTNNDEPKSPVEAVVEPEKPVEPPTPKEPVETLETPVEAPPMEKDPAEVVDVKPPRDPLDLVNDKPGVATNDAAELRKLEKQLNKIGAEAEPIPGDTKTDEESPKPSPELPVVTDKASSRPRPEPQKVDLAARLNDRLIEIELTGQSLATVLQLLSDFTRIPITLDPDALAWSKVTPATPIHAKLSNATVEEVLAEILKPPVRLEAVKLDDQLVITRSSAPRKLKCPIDDLTGGDATKQKQLIEMIEALAAPTTWKSAGGSGTLTPQGPDLLVDNTELAYGEVLHVCERLRQARGGRPRSTFPAELFSLQRRSLRATAKLDQPLTLNFGQPTPLVKILARLSEETGMQILVDWQAAGEIGWPPDADATVTLSKTPLREALAKLLEPMDLTYRVVDASVIQVTTLQAMERKPELEAYVLGDLAKTPEDTTGLMDLVAAKVGNGSPLRWDAASKTLFALLPQPRHAELAQVLDSLKARPATEEEKAASR